MTDEKKMLEELADKIIERMGPSMRQTLSQIVQDEVVKALRKALYDSAFYKNLSEDAVSGIEKIYSTISSVKKDMNIEGIIGDAFQSIEKSESILDSVLKITEDAALQIMDIIEEMQDIIGEARENLLADNMQEILDSINRKLLDIMTLLSFQDLAGQKIKKLIQVLKNIEGIAFELYIQTEAIRKARDLGEEIDYEELRERVRRQMLKEKPQVEVVDQYAVDALIESIAGS
ncbi:protein phosphatase CheZ [Thermodesulforhabdus norvegica]|uniref:Chemotaxis protein CheZ n=1 Tax=Thermodesulforhabdus norvegica TaxID=39841 RepID=A0A1I4RCL3_9BACT|nr:protein phosphatase CheZ [Thermodesulforhabdus norvegica]SFM49700.1 chemotaxis protein CheZ [Thermodesulforhabdus norvegica]